MLARPKTVNVQPLFNLSQSLLAFAGDAEGPSLDDKGIRVILRDAVLLANL
jgi:hypothetical protein